MKTVIVPAPGKIEIRQVETPVINAYQALVKTEMVRPGDWRSYFRFWRTGYQ